MKRAHCLLVILVLLLAVSPLLANIEAESFTLSIDDVTIAPFTGNLTRLSLKVHANCPDNFSLFLLFESYDSFSAANWYLVPKEYDALRNITIFSIDVVIPLTPHNSFPQDNYTFVGFLGTNYAFDNATYGFGWLSMSFANYEGFWDLAYFGNFSDVQKEMEMPFPGTTPSEFGNSWCKLTLSIRHVKGFADYANMLVNQVPQTLFYFSIVITIIPVLTIVDAVWQKRRESPKANMIEKIVIPVCIAILLFIPIFQLSIRPIKEPFTYILQDSFFFQIFEIYLAVLSMSIIVRLIIRSPHQPQTIIKKKEQSGTDGIGLNSKNNDRIVTTFIISIVVLVLFWTILFMSRNFNITVSDSVAVFLSILPFIIYLVVFEKISEVSGGGWQVRFRQAAETNVSFEPIPIEFLAYRVESKGHEHQLQMIRERMRTQPMAVLSLTLGRRYDAEVLIEYLRVLTRFDFFKYVVFIDMNSRFMGLVYARAFLDICEDHLPRENRCERILGSIEGGNVDDISGIDKTFIVSTQSNIEALEMLDHKTRFEMPVVSQNLQFLGFTSREIILSSILRGLLKKA